MIINTKDEFKKLVEMNLFKYPLVKTYFEKAIQKQFSGNKDLKNLLEYSLLRYLAMNYEGLKNLEEYLNDGSSFTNIRRPIKRLENNFDEYSAVFSEMFVAKKLHKEGMTNISFLSERNNGPDIEYFDNGIKRYAEVKSFESLNPDFSVLYDKLQTKSLLSKDFKNKTFFVSCDYQFSNYKSVSDIKINLSKAVDKLIEKIEPMLQKNNIENLETEIDFFKFKISSYKSSDEITLVYESGSMNYKNRCDYFLDLSSTYCRFINNFKRAYTQILAVRNGDIVEAKKDRIYLFINLEKHSLVFKNEINSIFKDLYKTLGIDDLIDVHFET